MYYVYMLRCADGSLYTGITPDPRRRLQAHLAGRGAKYTRSHPPVEVAALWRADGRTAAARLEYAVKKRLDKEQKERLVSAPEAWRELLPHLSELAIEPAEVTADGE